MAVKLAKIELDPLVGRTASVFVFAPPDPMVTVVGVAMDISTLPVINPPAPPPPPAVP
jgi:hypothetical protein